MDSLKKTYLFNNFSHIYIEKAAFKYQITQDIIQQFSTSPIIEIHNYQDFFNRPKQNIISQKKSIKLILAVKYDSFYYELSDLCHNFGYQDAYYSSCVYNCVYNCQYCFLNGMYGSSNIVIFVNLEDYFSNIKNLIQNKNIHLSISYDSDLLAIENITHYVKSWIEFTKLHKNLIIEIRTKSSNFRAIESIAPVENVILAWSLSPESIIEKYEYKTPTLDARISSIKSAIKHGWKIRLCFDPIINIPDWENVYQNFIDKVFSNVEPDYICDLSLGTFRIPKDYLKIIKKMDLPADIIYYPYNLKNNTYYYENEALLVDTLYRHTAKFLPTNKIFTNTLNTPYK